MSPARSGSDAAPSGSAPAVVRAVAVLDALAASESGYLTLSDVARELGIPKSSTRSICNALEQGGLIRREDIGYRLGLRVVELGGSALSRLDQVVEFYEICSTSPALAPETLRLSVLAGIETLCLARYEGHPPLRLTAGIGDKLPASACAQGKALLAQLEDFEVKRLYHGIPELPRVTRQSRRSLSRLLKDLALTRQRGYAVDEEESADHVIGLAVPVSTRGVRSAQLAVSVTLLDAEVTPERQAAMLAELRRVARLLGNPMQPERRSNAG